MKYIKSGLKEMIPNGHGGYTIFDTYTPIYSLKDHQNGLKITLIRLLAVCLPGICMAMHWGVGITPFLIFPAFALTGVMNKTGFKANLFGALTGGIVATVLFMLLMKHVA